MSTPTKPTVRGNRPDALDDPFKMAHIARYLVEGVELAAGKFREDGSAGAFPDIDLGAARRFVQQSLAVAGEPEHVPPVGS